MIGVTGATGQLGRLVIENLLKKTAASNIVALVRDAAKANELKALGVDVRQADYEQPETLTAAFAGIEKLLLISSNAVGSRVPQHLAVIQAAKEAGVQLFVYTSVLKAGTNPMMLAAEHKPTEAAIQESGIPAVILRNGWYTENYTQNIPAILQTGVVAGAAKDGKFHTAARNDYAEAAAVVLTSEASHAGNVYELAGDAGFTLAEFAAEVAAQSGKEIAFQDMSGEDFANLLVQVGLPEGFAAALADSEVHAANGWLEETGGTLSTLIGRPAQSLSAAVTAALNASQ